jgi:hypothetical protein
VCVWVQRKSKAQFSLKFDFGAILVVQTRRSTTARNDATLDRYGSWYGRKRFREGGRDEVSHNNLAATTTAALPPLHVSRVVVGVRCRQPQASCKHVLCTAKHQPALKACSTQSLSRTHFFLLCDRHRMVLRDTIQGVTKPAIRRLARRGGVKRIIGLIYEETRGVLKLFLEKIIRDTVLTPSMLSVRLLLPWMLSTLSSAMAAPCTALAAKVPTATAPVTCKLFVTK